MPRSKAVKTRAPAANDHWSLLSDEELISLDLTTDDPERLSGLVSYIPERHSDAHVEYKYDYRGQEREMLTCVHGHHKHKAGYVMKVGEERFLVGWMCGEMIYGENFDRYTSSYEAAVDRQSGLRRAKQIRDALDPFKFWLTRIPHMDAFQLYTTVRLQWVGHIPWLYEQLKIKCLKHAGQLTVVETVRDIEAEKQDRVRYERECQTHAKGGSKPQPSRSVIFKEEQKVLCALPCKLFFENPTNPAEAVVKTANTLLAQIAALERALNGQGEIERLIQAIREELARLEDVIREVAALEDLFQPLVLAKIAEWANRADNSKRKYKAGLNDLTMTNSKGDFTVGLPKNYVVPDRSALAQFRLALATLPVARSS